MLILILIRRKGDIWGKGELRGIGELIGIEKIIGIWIPINFLNVNFLGENDQSKEKEN